MGNRWEVTGHIYIWPNRGNSNHKPAKNHCSFDLPLWTPDDWHTNVVQYAAFDFVAHGNKKQEVRVALWLRNGVGGLKCVRVVG